VLNILLALFNLIPAFPMDGGRLLRAVLWLIAKDYGKASWLATRIARAFGFFIIGSGLVLAAAVDPILGLWGALIGWFIYRAAETDYRRVQLAQLMAGVSVRDVMERDVPVVSPNLTLDTFVDQLMADEAGLYPVTTDGGLVGTVDVDQVRRVPQARWPTTRITDVMSRFETLRLLTEPQPVTDAVGQFQTTSVPAIPVVDDEDRHRLLGIVTRDGLIRALRRREALRGS
jgi:CBS domain-containing protein